MFRKSLSIFCGPPSQHHHRRRRHTKLFLWGSFAGLSPIRPTEVFLDLPPRSAVGAPPSSLPSFASSSSSSSSTNIPPSSSSSSSSLKPEWEICSVAAGTKHLAMVTVDGHVILMGNNRHGQIGQPRRNDPSQFGGGGSSGSSDPLKSLFTASDMGFHQSELIPYFYDFEFEGEDVKEREQRSSSDEYIVLGTGSPDAVACGTNFTIIYKRNTRVVLCVGSNTYGQLGLGHKDTLDNNMGFSQWDPHVSWWREEDKKHSEKLKLATSSSSSSSSSSSLPYLGIKDVVCGHTHTLFLMTDGSVYSCGSNQWGELGLGSTDSPMHPMRIKFFDELEKKERAEAEEREKEEEEEAKGNSSPEEGEEKRRKRKKRKFISPSSPDWVPKSRVISAAAGNEWSLFLTAEGKVYGSGAHLNDQLPMQAGAIPYQVPLFRPGTEKVMRVKALACLADMGVYVTGTPNAAQINGGALNSQQQGGDSSNDTPSSKTEAEEEEMKKPSGSTTTKKKKKDKVGNNNEEVFLKGTIIPLGVQTHAKLFPVEIPITPSSSTTNGENKCGDGDNSSPSTSDPIVFLKGHANNAILVTRSGRVFGFGANTEGQVCLDAHGQLDRAPSSFISTMKEIFPPPCVSQQIMTNKKNDEAEAQQDDQQRHTTTTTTTSSSYSISTPNNSSSSTNGGVVLSPHDVAVSHGFGVLLDSQEHFTPSWIYQWHLRNKQNSSSSAGGGGATTTAAAEKDDGGDDESNADALNAPVEIPLYFPPLAKGVGGGGKGAYNSAAYGSKSGKALKRGGSLADRPKRGLGSEALLKEFYRQAKLDLEREKSGKK